MKIFTVVFLFVIQGFFLNPSAQAEIKPSLKTGPQLDHLEWTIGPNPGFIISELIFNSVSIYTEGAVTWYDARHPWFLEMRGGYGKMLSGTVIDSDWLSPGRQNLFSESESSIDGHNINLAIL